MPSKDSVGVDNVRTLPLSVGYDVDASSGTLKLPINGWISKHATAVALTMQAGALSNGSVSTPAMSGSVAPGNLYGDGRVKLRLLPCPTGRNGLVVEHSILDVPFRVNAMGGYHEGLAGVLFSVSDGVTTVEHFVANMERSTYQDRNLVSNAQWAKNLLDSGDSVRGGLGVWASPDFDPATFADGPVTITATGYAYVGGALNSTSESWTAYANSGGRYQERVRYVDTVAGSDTTGDGLSAATAWATPQKAIRAVGSLNGGATSNTIGIVKIVGSGNPAAPRVVDVVNDSANNNDLCRITDTWVTIQPAEGHSAADTWLRSNNANLGVRRLHVKDLSMDVSRASNPSQNISLFSTNSSDYPNNNKSSIWIDGVDTFHSLGVAGNLSSGNSGFVLGTDWSDRTVFFTRYTVRDMDREGHTTGRANTVMRDALFQRVTVDVISGPRGVLFGIKALDNLTVPGAMKFASVSGTIQVGDAVSGVRSAGTATVSTIYASTSIQTTNVVGRFKEDDAVVHGAVTVSNAAGFQVGENVNGQKLHRIDGNILRFGSSSQTAFLPGVGTTLTGASSGAQATVISRQKEENIFFSPSGARGSFRAPHPDVIQVGAFLRHRVLYTQTAGTFAIGDNIETPNLSKGVVQGFGTTIDGRAYMDVDGGTWFTGEKGQTIRKNVDDGTYAIFDGVYDFPSGFRNDVLANLWAPNGEGAAFFAENGTNGAWFANIAYVGADGTRENPFQWGRIQDVSLIHMQAHQRPVADNTSPETAPRSRMQVLGLLGQSTSPNAIPGVFSAHMHEIDTSITSTKNSATRGAPQFVNGVGFNEDADPARSDYTPQAGSPLRQIPAMRDGAWMPFDLFGNRRPTNGTAAVGAIEAMGL